jgi:hypothetical protein
MAFDDMFVRDENGKRTNQVKPEYPTRFSCYVTGSNGELFAVYLTDVSKDWMPEINWKDEEPNKDAEISFGLPSAPIL